MKHLIVVVFSALFASPMSGEDVYTLREVSGNIILLNTQSGASYLLAPEGPTWKPIAIESGQEGQQDFQGLLSSIDMTVPPLVLPGPWASRSNLAEDTAIAAIQLANASKQTRTYRVEALLPRDAKEVSIYVFHRTVEGTMSGEALPRPESEFTDDTAAFSVRAKPAEVLALQIVFRHKLPSAQVKWTAHDDVGGSDVIISSSTRTKGLFGPSHPTFTDLGNGTCVPAPCIVAFATEHGITHSEARAQLRADADDHRIKEHAAAYGISVPEAKKQIDHARRKSALKNKQE